MKHAEAKHPALTSYHAERVGRGDPALDAPVLDGTVARDFYDDLHDAVDRVPPLDARARTVAWCLIGGGAILIVAVAWAYLRTVLP